MIIDYSFEEFEMLIKRFFCMLFVIYFLRKVFNTSLKLKLCQFLLKSTLKKL
jgi:hypothetical protein